MLGIVATVSVAAQVPGRTDAARHSSLPFSNEAGLLVQELADAVEREEYDRAFRLAEELEPLSDELVPATNRNRFVVAWRSVAEQFEDLPADARAALLERRLVSWQQRYEAAREQRDLPELRALYRETWISDLWPEVARDLATALLDRGAAAEAASIAQDAITRGVADEAVWYARRAIALRLLGDSRAATAQLERARQRSAEGMPAGSALPERVAERLLTIERWIASEDDAPSALDPLLRPQIAWQATWPDGAMSNTIESEGELVAIATASRRLPLSTLHVSDGVVLARQLGVLAAFEAATLKPLWSVGAVRLYEAVRESRRDEFPLRIPDEDFNDGEGVQSQGAERLFANAVEHTLAKAGGAVFTIEEDRDNYARSPRLNRFGPASRLLAPNRLVARELRSGAARWTIGAPGRQPFGVVTFLSNLITTERFLLVAARRNEEVALLVINQADGAPIAELPLIGPPLALHPNGGQFLLTHTDGTVYFCSGNGVLGSVALDAVSGALRWNWVQTYSSSAVGRATSRFRRIDEPIELGPPAVPIVAAGEVIVAPADSDRMFAYDRQSGDALWSRNRAIGEAPVGVVDGLLILRSDALQAIRVRDGAEVVWRSVSLAMTGRPVRSEREIIVPTRDGLVVLSATDGRVVRDQWRPSPSPPAKGLAIFGTPAVDRGDVYMLTPQRLVKFPSRARVPLPTGDEPLAIALHAAAAGDFPQAYEALSAVFARDDTRQRDEDPTGELRDRLMQEVLIGLAESARTNRERLDWLERAWNQAEGAHRPLVALMFGDVLAATGDPEAALERYRSVLRDPQNELVALPESPQLARAAWRLAAERCNQLIVDSTARDRERLLELLMDRAERASSVTYTARLLEAVALDAQSVKAIAHDWFLALERADQTGAGRAPDPALMVAWAPLILGHAELGDDDRVQIGIRLWEAHLALGDVESATRAQTDFERAVVRWEGSTARTRRDLPLSIQSRARHAAQRTKRLASFSATPYDRALAELWRLPKTELVATDADVDFVPQSIVVRQLSDEKLVKIDPYRAAASGHPLRDTHNRRLTLADALGGPAERDRLYYDPPTSRWPGVRAGRTHIVATRNGLAALSGGEPRRDATDVLWELRRALWREVPAALDDVLVGVPDAAILLDEAGQRVISIDRWSGALRWQRTLDGSGWSALDALGDSLLVTSPSGRLLELDTASGRVLRSVESSRAIQRFGHAGHWIEVDPGRVRVRAPGAGSDAWTRPLPQRAVVLPVVGQVWFSVYDPLTRMIELIDVASGNRVHQLRVELQGSPRLMWSDGARLLQVCSDGLTSDTQAPMELTLRSDALDASATSWQRTLYDVLPPNVSQLAANPKWIPVLHWPRGNSFDAYEDLTLILIDRETGKWSTEWDVHLGLHVPNARADRPAYLVNTASVIVVQAGGAVLGFGNERN